MSIRLTAESWPSRAACAGDDTEMWFPPGTADPDPLVVRVCAGCPVRTDCLEYAIATRQCGVWGGMTEDQRAKERKNRQRRGAAERAVA